MVQIFFDPGRPKRDHTIEALREKGINNEESTLNSLGFLDPWKR